MELPDELVDQVAQAIADASPMVLSLGALRRMAVAAIDAIDLPQLLLAERLSATERAAKIAEEFGWVLPVFESAEVNEATDDAACVVQAQIAAAIRSHP